MAISRVEIKDFLVFKDEFAVDFCPGVNVLIGGNGTGKTTLLKCLFYGADRFSKPKKWPVVLQNYFGLEDFDTFDTPPEEIRRKYGMIYTTICGERFEFSYSFFKQPKSDKAAINPVYIPEKDILEHAKGLLPFIEQKQTGFTSLYKDVLIKAQDVPTQKQSETQKKVGGTIRNIIGGEVVWEQAEGTFYTIHADGTRIPFAAEASGFKKLGYLGLLVACGQLESGSILFWDEPENSLNPELVPKLVEILLELSRNGVQIFLATHSEILASYFSVLRNSGNSVMFYSLYKDGEQIKAESNDRFDLLTPNNLTVEPVRLYEKKLERVFSDE